MMFEVFYQGKCIGTFLALRQVGYWNNRERQALGQGEMEVDGHG